MIPVRRSSIVRRSSLQENPYIRGLYDFFYGEAWSRNLNSFIDAHCSIFELDPPGSSSEDCGSQACESKYDHGHFDVFQQFKDWVFLLLNTHFGDLGIDEEQFTAICEKELKAQESCPSHRLTFVVQYLKTLTDFNEFAAIMREAAAVSRKQMIHQQQLNSQEWQLQCALAASLVHAEEEGVLSCEDQVLLDWAKAVLKLDAILREKELKDRYDINLEAQDAEVAQASEHLRIERLKVEIEVAKRMKASNETLKKEIPDLAHIDQCMDKTSPTTPLVDLIESSGKVELALSSYRSKVRSHKAIAKEEREKLYLSIREITKSRPFPLLGPNQIAQIKRMLDKYGGSKIHSSIVEDFVHLIWLENHHHHLCKRIQKEVHSPTSNSASNQPRQSPAHSSNPTSSPSQSDVSSPSKPPQTHRKPSLTIKTSQDDEGTYSLDQIASFSSKLGAQTPKEARDAMELMEAELKKITAKQELMRVRLAMIKNARNAQEQTGDKQTEALKSAQRLGTDYTRLQAMTNAEMGDEMIYPLDEAGPQPDNPVSSTLTYNYDSDATEPDEVNPNTNSTANSSSNETSNEKHQANHETGPKDLLHKTEKLRQEILIRGQANGRSVSRQHGIVLNSPTARRHPQGFPQAELQPVRQGKPAQPLPDNYGTAKLSVNPTGLRFLASHVADYKHHK